jgi:hypothetical protein
LLDGGSSEFEQADAVAGAIENEIQLSKANSSEYFATETEVDREIEVESWMTNETLFVHNFKVNEETDPDLKLENWMVSFGSKTDALNSIQEGKDQPLAVEGWMTNEAMFTSANMADEADKMLDLESWMVEDSIFTSRLANQQEPLKLEAWMSDANLW